MVGKIRIIGDKHNRWFDVEMGDIVEEGTSDPLTGLVRYEINPIEFTISDELFKFSQEWMEEQQNNSIGIFWVNKEIEFKSSKLDLILEGCIIDSWSSGTVNTMDLRVEYVIYTKSLIYNKYVR